MTLRRLCNVAFTVLADGLPFQVRGDLDRRLSDPKIAGVEEPAQELTVAEKAQHNRDAMAQLMGVVRKARPA